MSLTFYSCGDPANKMNKSLTTLGSTSYFKPNYQNGTSQVSYLLDSGMPSGTNYIYDSELGRYYFVVEVIHDTARRIVVNCLLDALYTFRGKLGGTFYFVRGAEKVNEMEDTNYPLSDYIKTETFNIDGWDTGFFKNLDAGNHYYLKTAVGRAKASTVIPLAINDLIHNGKSVFKITAVDDKVAFAEYQYDNVPPSGVSIVLGDLISINGRTYQCEKIANEGSDESRYISFYLYE